MIASDAITVAKDITATLQSVATILAFMIGGWWTYEKFIVQRLDEAAADLDIDVRFVGTQDNKWIVEITTTVNNKSLVRMTYWDFNMKARYFLAGDALEDGPPDIRHQLKCSRTIDERINGQARLYANVDYINPKQEFRHRYITYIPIDATFLWIQCKFPFKLDARGDPKQRQQEKPVNSLNPKPTERKMNSQKIFAVPRMIQKLERSPSDP